MPADFSTISRIDPADARTWEGKLFLTLDIDWAIDEVIAHAIDLVEASGAAATWFVTHDTPLLARLRANPRFEVGIHPNFNGLLGGTEGAADPPGRIVERLLALVPGARAVRSHSMTQSSRLLDLFAGFGLTHDCNHFIPATSGITLRPWRHWNGMVKVPYFWEDDVALLEDSARSPAELAQAPGGVKVFDFHPIHVALNTRDIKAYEASRGAQRQWGAIQAARHAGSGTMNRLAELLALAVAAERQP